MLTKLWRIMDEHSENFKKIRCIRKYQIEIITELKNTLEGFNSRLDEKKHKGSVKHTNVCTIGSHRGGEKRRQEMCFKK